MFLNLKRKVRNLSYSGFFYNRIYFSLNVFKTKVLSVLSDETYAKIKYYENTGFKLNVKNPVTFNDKLWWLKINFRIPLMTKCSDKVEVHNFLAEIDLSHLSNEVVGVYNKAEDVPFDKLKGKYFIKCNHVSGVNVVFDSNSTFDKKHFLKKFNDALKINYYYQSREWNYKNINPKILVENYIETKEPLLDYRFLCFSGKVKLIFIDIETAAEDGSHNPAAKRNVYDKDFNLQDFTVGREGFDPILVTKPYNLDAMIKYAEKISSHFPFCRVDLYNLDGAIKFGEVTFYPGGGTQQFSCKEKDLEVASWITII